MRRDISAGLTMSNAHRQHAHEVLAAHTTLWVPAPEEEDFEYGTDLVNLRSGELRAALRVRGEYDLVKWHHSFTMRTHPKDEVRKLVPEFYIYGWASRYWQAQGDRARMVQWVLMDARAIRRLVLVEQTLKPQRHHDNGDGTQFDSYRFDERFVIARSQGGSSYGQQLAWTGAIEP